MREAAKGPTGTEAGKARNRAQADCPTIPGALVGGCISPAYSHEHLLLYRQLLDNHLLPALGHLRLQTLSPQHIDELYAQKLKEGYAAETVRAIHRMLHRALQDAVK